MPSEWVRVCDAKSLSNGEMVEFDHAGKKVMVAKAAGQLYATDRICTHAYADLATGFMNEDACTVTCPLHLSAFNLKDGVPQNPPATEPLKTYKVKIQDEGIYVELDRQP
ncbi:non-heme iron oxygenase ferredoxin subunit [Nitrososphaera sp.]|uniref:Rieske (2Fe-2S) protein n=1 Tax=Nitrososphaera sp. TaxID=1971748 RepID=UPI00307E3323